VAGVPAGVTFKYIKKIKIDSTESAAAAAPAAVDPVVTAVRVTLAE